MAQRVNSASFLNTLHYCCSSNAPKISNPQNYDIREMEKDKNEWVNDWESVLCIYTNTHYMSICMWSNLSSWTIKHQLQEGTTCYLYIRVVVKKTERGKVSYMELFVKSEEKLIYLCSLFQLHQAMKRHTYYLWLALKCSSRNKAKETSFLYGYVQFRNMDGNVQIELICISPLDHCLHFNLNLGHTTLKCDKYLSWGAKNSGSDC